MTVCLCSNGDPLSLHQFVVRGREDPPHLQNRPIILSFNTGHFHTSLYMQHQYSVALHGVMRPFCSEEEVRVRTSEWRDFHTWNLHLISPVFICNHNISLTSTILGETTLHKEKKRQCEKTSSIFFWSWKKKSLNFCFHEQSIEIYISDKDIHIVSSLCSLIKP